MNPESGPVKNKKLPVGRLILLSFLVVLLSGFTYLYYAFNRLLADEINRAFNANIISEVYDLKFEKLRVNVFEGSVSVSNVSMEPRPAPARVYPYINSSFRLGAEELTLLNVDLIEFLLSKRIDMQSIRIMRPHFNVKIDGRHLNLFPLKDSATVSDDTTSAATRNVIDALILRKFELIDASFQVNNSFKERTFRMSGFNISLNDVLLTQEVGRNVLAISTVGLSLADFDGSMKKGSLQRARFQDFEVTIDSLYIHTSVDAVNYQVEDFTGGLKRLDVQTSDSLFHLTVKSFGLSYKDRSISLDSMSFKPNISYNAMQRRYKFQLTQFSGDVVSVKLVNLNFDSLAQERSLLVDEIAIISPRVTIFKDNTKPIDEKRRPKYFGEQISSIPLPLQIKTIRVGDARLINLERKPDGDYAKVMLTKGNVTIGNITNLDAKNPLAIEAQAYINDKVPFHVRLDFSYVKPEFNFHGNLKNFDLTALNPLIVAYTPATIQTGIADEIDFSGTIDSTSSRGIMKFLYHDLKVDVDLKDRAKWKSSAVAFAANSIVNESNPPSASLPTRIVRFRAVRNMNKGFTNILIKSVLAGIQETMFMSKENRKAYQDSKKKLKNATASD